MMPFFLTMPPLLKLENLTKRFAGQNDESILAVDNVSFTMGHGEALALVGESGSGKSTIARLITRLETPSDGHIWWTRANGTPVDLAPLIGSDLRKTREGMQMVFQNPHGSLDPRQTVFSCVAEALEAKGPATKSQRREQVAHWLGKVQMEASAMDRHPHEFSGGQRQRIALARALAAEPRLVIADEPTSALDVSIQAKILNLLADLVVASGVSLLLITHNLHVARHLCQRMIVLKQGRIVEEAETSAIFENPSQPYTRQLLEALPTAVA
jgi:phosphonate C-P lyase system protein PhnK